jgi:beta-1,4-mannosyl-glycoprotein beta-1,4-N-acetylglucosaminyltransferase
MKKIYDTFLFFNELDLLEIRLTMLYPHVDYFVISECDYTFSGKQKPFYFDENKEKFSKFMDKIIHIKHYNTNEHDYLPNTYNEDKKKEVFDKLISNYLLIKNTPETDNGKPHWCREYLQREYVGIGLSECNDEDIIIFSDLDEIPRPEIIAEISNLNLNDNKYFLYTTGLQYYINNLSNTNWMGSVIASYGNIKNMSLNNLRKHRGSYSPIENAGWHLSFMGGVERIKMKLDSYGHQEYNNDFFKSNVENKLKQNTDILNRNNYSSRPQIEQCYFENMIEFDLNNYPNNIIELVKEKYPYLIK